MGKNIPYFGLLVGGLLAILGGCALVMALRRRRRPSGLTPDNRPGESPLMENLPSRERYTSVFVSQNPRFSLDRGDASGQPVLSIPVESNAVEYSEWYKISEQELEQFLADEELAREFAWRCGRREEDERLVLKPGTRRGSYSG